MLKYATLGKSDRLDQEVFVVVAIVIVFVFVIIIVVIVVIFIDLVNMFILELFR